MRKYKGFRIKNWVFGFIIFEGFFFLFVGEDEGNMNREENECTFSPC